MIGSILTGQRPRANVPLVPTGPWRGVVVAATQFDPGRRPQSIAELLTIVERELDEPEPDVFAKAEALLAAAKAGKAMPASNFCASRNSIRRTNTSTSTCYRRSQRRWWRLQ